MVKKVNIENLVLRVEAFCTRLQSFIHTSVLDTKSQNIPEVVVVRRGAGGVVGIWEGWVNWVKGSKWGQFTSNLRGRWTIPVTTGGCQVSGKGHKGETKGS